MGLGFGVLRWGLTLQVNHGPFDGGFRRIRDVLQGGSTLPLRAPSPTQKLETPYQDPSRVQVSSKPKD